MDSTIAHLRRGQRGIIKSLKVETVPLKLLEMGCLPGNEVELVQTAPFKDPMYLKINDTHLVIRKETARQVEIEILP